MRWLIRAIRIIRLIRDLQTGTAATPLRSCLLPFRAGTGAPPLRFYFRIFLMRSSTFIWVCFPPFIRVIRAIRLIRDPPLYLAFSGEHEGIAPTFLFSHLSYAFIYVHLGLLSAFHPRNPRSAFPSAASAI